MTNSNENGYLQIGGDSVQDSKSHSTVYLHTGNIANWSNLKSRKSNDIPMNELHQSFSRTLEKWVEEKGSITKKDGYVNCYNAEKMDDNERGLLKVTVKIFLQQFKVEVIKEAINLALTQLGIKHIDGVYLSLPPLEPSSNFAEVILPFWEEMERLRDAGVVTQISSCDLDRDKLKTLVEMVRIKPEVNQVNLASCCHMPEDLVSYAKDAGIVLHTHGDHPIMLSDETLKDLIHNVEPENTTAYRSDWLVRYAVVVKCRGVIKNKGYIVSIKSDKDVQNGSNGSNESNGSNGSNGHSS